ncbi:MAG TPA: hypothetical protein VJT67_11185 [Longimicrobiaceae bacterium]|nr:hypothetical protein [Longimicrobiaceae bacterium]
MKSSSRGLRLPLVRLCALLAAAAACSSPTHPRDPAGVKVLSGASVSDSATAVLAQPLVVEVRDSAGKLMAGVNVQFQASTLNLNGFDYPSLLFSTVPGQYFPVATATTDATGRVAVSVMLGRVAGAATVNITVPTLGYATSATFSVVPGAPAHFDLSPADSAVYVGSSYALRSRFLDRWGNPVTAPGVTYTSSAAAATVSGGSVNGVSVGRAQIVAQTAGGGVADTVFVSVVPQGTLLASSGDGIYVFGLDGSGMRRVVTAVGARAARWFPNGQQFVYTLGLGHAYVSDLNGSVHTLLQDPSSSFQGEIWAHPSRDGQWVYFGGYSGFEFRGYPYRVHPDGTGLSLVPGFVPDDRTQAHPSASPTGDRVAYFRERSDSRDVVIRVQRLDGTFSALDIPGHSPEWSHGDSIAFLDLQGRSEGPIKLMASNGTGQRYVGTASSYYDFGIDWSPDDKFIVAREVFRGRLELIEVATGRIIPLPYSSALSSPAWHP